MYFHATFSNSTIHFMNVNYTQRRNQMIAKTVKTMYQCLWRLPLCNFIMVTLVLFCILWWKYLNEDRKTSKKRHERREQKKKLVWTFPYLYNVRPKIRWAWEMETMNSWWMMMNINGTTDIGLHFVNVLWQRTFQTILKPWKCFFLSLKKTKAVRKVSAAFHKTLMKDYLLCRMCDLVKIVK